jgi:hypothetical protein
VIFSDAERFFDLAPLIIAFPVLGLLINMIFGRRAGERFVGVVASSAVGFSFLIAVLQFLALSQHADGARVLIADWIHIGTLDIPWSLKVDSLSVTMMLMVTGVSTLLSERSGPVLPFLCLLQPIRRSHDGPHYRGQLPHSFCGVGGCRPVLLSADRILV